MSGQAGLPPVMAFVMTTDDAGRVWLGYYLRKCVAAWRNGKARTFGENEGLNVGSVFVIHAHGQHVWVGGEQGLTSRAITFGQ